MNEIGKAILSIGVVLVVVGAALMLGGRLGVPLGRMPGDMAFRGKHFAVFFPLGTSIVVSIVLSLLFYLLSRLHR